MLPLQCWRHAPREYHLWVDILSIRSHYLYIGMTNDLKRRTGHRTLPHPSSLFHDVRSAIAREKQLKHWSREREIELIERVNPTWKDLYLTLQKSEADSLRE